MPKTLSKQDQDTILYRMFQSVGLTGQDFQSWDFSAPEWYTTHTWTPEQEKEYTEWLMGFIRAQGYYRNARAAEQAANWWLLSYGWKTEYPSK